MSVFLNIIWLILGGLELAIAWWLAAFLMAITLIGLPWVPGAIRMGLYCLWPFDTEQVDRLDATGRHDLGTGGLGTLGNIIWFFLAGWWLALLHFLLALAYAISLIGLPFAYAHLKLAGAALFPIGKLVRAKSDNPSPFSRA